jgi:hypothetical protein
MSAYGALNGRAERADGCPFLGAKQNLPWPTATSGNDLGCVETVLEDVGPGSQKSGLPQAAMAAISGLIPTMFMTRVRL